MRNLAGGFLAGGFCRLEARFWRRIGLRMLSRTALEEVWAGFLAAQTRPLRDPGVHWIGRDGRSVSGPGRTFESASRGQRAALRSEATTLLLTSNSTTLVTAKKLWGEQYHRNLADLLAVQNDIAREVSQHLRSQLSAGRPAKTDQGLNR
jgi:hypothetical protein